MCIQCISMRSLYNLTMTNWLHFNSTRFKVICQRQKCTKCTCSSTSLSNFELCIANHRFLSQLVPCGNVLWVYSIQVKVECRCFYSCCISMAIICCMAFRARLFSWSWLTFEGGFIKPKQFVMNVASARLLSGQAGLWTGSGWQFWIIWWLTP